MADLNTATIVTTIADADYIFCILSTGDAVRIAKSDLSDVLLGTNVSITDLDKLANVTATASELNNLDGFTGDVDDLNILSGATVTSTEFGYLDGVTSAIQTQLDDKVSATTFSKTKLGYSLEFKTGVAETTKVIDADDILTALGLTSSTHYIFPAYNIDLFTGTYATTMTLVDKSSYGNTGTKQLIPDSTYGIDKINLSSLTSSTDYVIELSVRAVPNP